MKRFKKVLALVLAGVLALAMLTACENGAEEETSSLLGMMPMIAEELST